MQTQQRLHEIYIRNLKNICNLEMSFEPNNVTAILGPNGNGKTTILHAIASAYQPVKLGDDYKFSNFFLPHPDALWQGSDLSIIHTYRNEKEFIEKEEQRYQKKTDRWAPRYANRPYREISYVGIDKCVPLIESENRNTRLHYSTKQVSEDVVSNILKKASYVLNKPYAQYNINTTAGGRSFIGVEAGGVRYSALSMSAGEQKVFMLLEKLYRASKNSLILIDELDLLLHDAALKKLIKVLVDRANEKSIQIIFTTHRESVLGLPNINIRHVFDTPRKTLVFNETKPDSINRLTGEQPRTLEVFVEDDLSAAIVKKVCSALGIKKHVSVELFGAASNGFTVLGGLLLKGEDCDRSLVLLDGDVYTTVGEKEKEIRKQLSGDDERISEMRSKAIQQIKQYNLPIGIKPEKYIHNMICNEVSIETNELNEIVNAAQEILAVNDEHEYVNEIIERLGLERQEGITKIVDVCSKAPSWAEYTEPLESWLKSHLDKIKE